MAENVHGDDAVAPAEGLHLSSEHPMIDEGRMEQQHPRRPLGLVHVINEGRALYLALLHSQTHSPISLRSQRSKGFTTSMAR